MTARAKAPAAQLRAGLKEFSGWLVRERDYYAARYRESGFGADREAANELHFVLQMLASKTRDECGVRDTPGFPILPS
ncbi:hypothetical protein [Amycolatopsis kentuckyensis]|uniref:hypothetical protein n=1 Tax=Amycolatopsis kentuckyensis TaxID=218823 RepID=UPI000A37AF03|nr:hypothetical protein [Amycolatopsis kentuckyensis]